jgi:dipeptidyl aminopeptidase/acylaminoacyl peptidase
MAGLAPDAEAPGSTQLVLFQAQAQPRKLGVGVRSARFSPDGSALAYQQDSAEAPNTIVLELTSGKTMEIAGLADPRWEADGAHIRGTLLQKAADGSVRWLRARWDRQSEATALVGPGSAQIPAPKGTAVAWSPDQPSENPSSSCIVRLGPPGAVQVPHKVQGAFCKGAADDRSVRWSPDGQWLAFAHPGPVPGAEDPSKSFLDVVAIAGGRSQTLTSLHHRMGPAASEIAVAPNPVWLDWSPSQRFLAITDGAGDLRVYDFEIQGIAALGKADRPQWSPNGSYLLILGPGEDGAPRAFVLKGATSSARIDLGPARDVRWIPAQVCDGSVAASQPS